jgi:hypothetical protein
LRLTCEGEDNLGKFTVFVPDKCGICGNVEAGLLYRGIKKKVTEMGIEPNSLIVFQNHKVLHLGITCGCYAKLQRQIAHISDKRIIIKENLSGDPTLYMFGTSGTTAKDALTGSKEEEERLQRVDGS